MYIDPFWAGVLATIFVEMSTLVVLSVVSTFKRGKRRGH